MRVRRGWLAGLIGRIGPIGLIGQISVGLPFYCMREFEGERYGLREIEAWVVFWESRGFPGVVAS